VRTLCSSVLMLQAIVLGLAIPVALALSDVDDALVLWVGGALIVCCFLATGLLGRGPVGLALGWVVQVGSVLSGFVVPAMFLLGLIFGALWYFAIKLGRKGDAATAAHRASLEDDPHSP
jgi:hypothetical protein